MKTTLITLVLTVLACLATGQFSEDPPYSPRSNAVTFPVKMDSQTGCAGRQCHLTVTISTPKFKPGKEHSTRKAPFPVIFYMNGFKLWGDLYKDYVGALVSWGYAVVQYNVPVISNPAVDRVELTYLDPLLSILKKQNDSGDDAARGLLDLGRFGFVGHSRGAKLSTLHFTRDDRVKTAFLIDPVDLTLFTQNRNDYPSAIEALHASNSSKRVGIVGSAVIRNNIFTSCQPKGNNFKDFWKVAKNRSWLSIVSGSGHLSFTSLPLAVQLSTCGGDFKTSSAETAARTIPSMINWVDHIFYPELQSPVDPLFRKWGKEQKDAGKLDEFTFKE